MDNNKTQFHSNLKLELKGFNVFHLCVAWNPHRIDCRREVSAAHARLFDLTVKLHLSIFLQFPTSPPSKQHSSGRQKFNHLTLPSRLEQLIWREFQLLTMASNSSLSCPTSSFRRSTWLCSRCFSDMSWSRLWRSHSSWRCRSSSRRADCKRRKIR